MLSYNQLKEKFFMITRPNVIESEEHILFMAKQLKQKKLFIRNLIYL